MAHSLLPYSALARCRLSTLRLCRFAACSGSARTQIQHPHPISETRGAKDPLGQRIKQLGLARQTPLLLCSISECVL
jgi:hypothetical protein